MKAIEKAIRYAINGGYHSELKSITGVDTDSVLEGKYFIHFWDKESDMFSFNTFETLLDPLFWKCLGVQQGWSDEYFYCNLNAFGGGEEYWFGSDCKNKEPEWKAKFHLFVDALSMDKSIESFFEGLLINK